MLRVILLSLISLYSFAQLPTAGLIAHYPFCGNATDASGNGNNGTVTGATLVNDRFGNSSSAYTFNGLNNYISLPPSNFINQNIYSYSIWIRPLSNAQGIPLSIGSNDAYCQSLSYNTTSVSAGSYNIGSNPVQSYVFSNTLSSPNSWIHVVVTRDQSILRLYVNGSLISGTNNNSATNNQAADYGYTAPYRTILGARSTLSSFFFNGSIDDVRFYSTVLSQSDVTALYNEVVGSPFSLSVANGSICPGSSFTLTPSGSLSYTYSSGSAIVNPSITTNYTITGSNVCGTSSAVATVSILPSPTLNITGPSVICAGQSAILHASGANTYNWNAGTLSAITVTPGLGNNTYTVIGTNGYGCSGFANFSIQVNTCTGSNEPSTNTPYLSIYPNPSHGLFTIQMYGLDNVRSSFVLEDLHGATLKKYDLNESCGTLQIMSELPAGCYLGKIIVNDKIITARKILIAF